MICPSCGQIYTPELMKQPDYDDKFREWKYDRTAIQHVWPDATPIQREQLQTGICSDLCWSNFLGGSDV